MGLIPCPPLLLSIIYQNRHTWGQLFLTQSLQFKRNKKLFLWYIILFLFNFSIIFLLLFCYWFFVVLVVFNHFIKTLQKSQQCDYTEVFCCLVACDCWKLLLFVFVGCKMISVGMSESNKPTRFFENLTTYTGEANASLLCVPL